MIGVHTGAVRAKSVIWEGLRWLSPQVFLAVVAVSTLSFVADTCSGAMLIRQIWQGELFSGSLEYFLEAPTFLGNMSLCLVIFTGASLYAQDYEDSAVYMRVQRMGVKRYAIYRVMQVSIPSWLTGCISILLVVPVLSAILHIPMFPQELRLVEGWSTSKILQSGRNVEFMATLGILSGLRSMFYALVTFAVSFFIPKKRVLVAIPLLFWYFSQYTLIWLEWVPRWLQPRVVFELKYGMLDGETLGFGKVSEWEMLLRIAIGMLCLVVAIWALFAWHLRRAGIFGGEQSE